MADATSATVVQVIGPPRRGVRRRLPAAEPAGLLGRSSASIRSASMAAISSRVRTRPSPSGSTDANLAIVTEPTKPTSDRTTSTGTTSVRRSIAA